MSAIQNAWNWLFSPAPYWAVHANLTFFHWIVPVIFVVTICLASVSQRQQRTPVQHALTRFLWSKAGFWAALWLAFHARFTVLWTTFDFVVLLATFVTSIELLYALVCRYIVERGKAPLDLEG